MKSLYTVVLCGGAGTRLWPLSRALKPKQLLALNGEETLLQQTVRRLLAHVTPDHLLTVTHEDYRFEVKGQLTEIDPILAQHVLPNAILGWKSVTSLKSGLQLAYADFLATLETNWFPSSPCGYAS